MDMAALPTAPIARALKRKGSMAPINNPAMTLGAETSITSFPAVSLNAANKARAVRAAEPIAKPLPMAAVVLPTASSLSVLFLTSGGSSAISASPPALSEIGP